MESSIRFEDLPMEIAEKILSFPGIIENALFINKQYNNLLKYPWNNRPLTSQDIEKRIDRSRSFFVCTKRKIEDGFIEIQYLCRQNFGTWCSLFSETLRFKLMDGNLYVFVPFVSSSNHYNKASFDCGFDCDHVKLMNVLFTWSQIDKTDVFSYIDIMRKTRPEFNENIIKRKLIDDLSSMKCKSKNDLLVAFELYIFLKCYILSFCDRMNYESFTAKTILTSENYLKRDLMYEKIEEYYKKVLDFIKNE